jgi:hypothetical protein
VVVEDGVADRASGGGLLATRSRVWQGWAIDPAGCITSPRRTRHRVVRRIMHLRWHVDGVDRWRSRAARVAPSTAHVSPGTAVGLSAGTTTWALAQARCCGAGKPWRPVAQVVAG